MTTAFSRQNPRNHNDDLALVGGTIYVSPAEEPISDGTVLIQSGKVVEVGRRASVQLPPTTPTLDCSGLVVTAGFWNSHVHLFERKWAAAATMPAAELERQLSDTFVRYGFTSVFDIGSMWENTRRLRDRIESGEVAGPRIRSTGEALVAPGAIPAERILSILGFMAFPAPEIVDAAQAATAARRLLDEGVDAIKVHLQTPPPPNAPFPESAIEAAVREAHRAGKPVFVHPNTGADILASVRAGADVVAHTTPRSGPWEETTVEAMKARLVALTPTLTLWKSAMRHDRISVQEQLVETALGQVRAWLAKGGTVLFGTDLGAVDPDPVEEYVLMAEAGMSFRQILASQTTTPAERFGAGQGGRIARGQDADLVVLEGDPSEDIRTLAAVRYTIRAGRLIYRVNE
ncbi:MAG TPA: amidohydrolase family protein [Vicinamibacteria bacterium]|nr:amidohydrolase family protein [Vicinamibacteria bacterium]